MNTGNFQLNESSPGRWQQRAADILLFLSFLLAAIPEQWLPEQFIPGAQHALWPYVASTIFTFTGYISRNKGMPAMLALFIFAALWMLAVGGLAQIDSFPSKSFGGDLVIFTAAIVGFMWAAQRDIPTIVFHIRAWVLVTLMCSAIALVALKTGLLQSVGSGNRLLVFSLFWATWLLVSVTPFLFASADIGTERSKWWLGVALMSVMSVFIIAVVSVTRSVFLWGIAGLLVLGIMQVNRHRLTLKLGVFVALIAITMAAGTQLIDSLTSGELGARFQDGAFHQDGRFIELREMCAEMNEGLALVCGKGFGSEFYSTGTDDGLGIGAYVLSPHIGILTTLFKGGICMFLLCVIVPFFRCATGLLASKGGTVQVAACGGVVLYCVMASLSGGWDFKNLFLFGMFLGIAVGPQRAMPEVTHSVEVPPTDWARECSA